MLVSWKLWKERNARVFNNTTSPSADVFHRIKEETALWVQAAARHLGGLQQAHMQSSQAQEWSPWSAVFSFLI
ncbi:hypothetical protein BAE44_0011009 [Dichanthelium oligosanthes]|uniref:Uncharacterized protein n=1 Tax=Dichanthelium oligosanthes TaxID=888268 RepID=A0A1E5VSA7_9POAL|nr:hypothetical protein BAE44_0011009 [Dichanthelium oligosanthes]